jgi:photosystem II stability/assembly factor-like uncharacterized protein
MIKLLPAQWIQTTYFSDQLVDEILVTDNYVFAGIKTAPCDIFKSSNNGDTWTSSSYGISYKCIYSLTTDGTNMYAGTWNSGVCKSSDYGTIWTPMNNGITFTAITAVACSSQVLWACGFNREMFYSQNAGLSWVSKGITENMTEDILIRPGRVLIGGNKGVITTTDNGTTWTNTSNGFADSTVMKLLSDGSTIYAATWGAGIYKSTNEGSTWIPVNNGLGNYNVFALIKTGNIFVAGTMGSGVFISHDNCNSWSAFNTGLPNNYPVYSLAVNNNYLFIGSYGISGGVWKRPLSDLTSSESTYNEENIAIWPNPAIQFLTIKNAEPFQIEIMNTSQIVLIKKLFSAGEHNLDISTLEKGFYILSITGKKGIQTRKLLVE